MTHVATYVSTLIVFIACDAMWLSTMVPRVYRPLLGDLLAKGVSFVPAAAFYLVYPIGLMLFAIQPGLKSGSILVAVVYGALFGFFTYATYDLTNHATLRNWPWQVTVLDIAWGTLLGAIAAAAGHAVASRVGAIA
ncbi:DUF2177 family protein [Xanthobacteraceae bacterium Astr-EGSB]|uniref:DUF2177 family protein n=1 Tax=Astrobacterium formosum TaxID=3069710 RepID=UPI0027AF4651|nr:DUF2177 family protein [Xanthobacteraceae bacterium Astr-EGSB]